MGHFARECRVPRNKEGQFRNQDNTRKQRNNEDTSSRAMLAIDGVGFDWSDMAEEQVQTNMALMTFSDSKKFDKASKDLDKLLGSQITDKNKKGLGYNVAPPPHPLIYNRPKKLDLSYSSLVEFKEPEFKGCGSENRASTREEVAKDDHRHTEAKDSPDEEQTERCNGSRKTPEMAIERSPAGAATDARQHREEERTNNQRAVRDATGREGAKQTERQTEEAQEASGQHKRNRSGETGRGTDGVPSRREIASNRCEESKKSTHRPATSSIREEGEDTAERTKKGRVARGGSAAATEREGKTRKQRDKRQSKERRRQTITEGREVRIREGVNEHQGGEIAEEWRSSEGAEQERAEFQGTRVDRGREGRTEAQGDRGRDVTATTQGKEGERGEKQRQRNEGQRRTTKRGRRRQEKLGSEQEDEQRQQREKGGRARAGQKEQETKQRENSGQPEEDKEVGTCDGRRTRRDDEDEYREEKKKSRGRADIGTAQRQKQKSRKKAKAKRHTGGGRQYGTKTTRAKRDRKREVGREVEADEEKSLEEHPPRVKRDNKRQDRGSKALRDGRRSDENE
ncbi:hypothetical protein Tco_0067351 [Tanacetum coccineum]